MSVTEGTILRIVVSYLLPESTIAQNVFNVVPTGGSFPYDVDDLIDDLEDYVQLMLDELYNLAVDGVTLDNMQVYEYDSVDDDWDEVGSKTWVWAGYQSGDMLPQGVAFYTQARSLDPDVSASKYWPGIDEGFNVDGVWTAPGLAAMAPLVAAWVAGDTGALTGALITAGVWSVVGTVFKAFNGETVINAYPAYQRRRKPGVGI